MRLFGRWRKKQESRQEYVEQLRRELAVLKEYGIEIRNQKAQEWFEDDGKKSEDEKMSLYSTLYALGGFYLDEEMKKEDGWMYCSDDVYCLDIESPEDIGGYETILGRLTVLSRGYLELRNIKDSFDCDEDKVTLTF